LKPIRVTFNPVATLSVSIVSISIVISESSAIKKGSGDNTGAAAAVEAVIGFNQFRHYTHDSSVVIGVMRRVGTCQAKLGLIEDQTLSSISGANESAYADQSTGGSLSRIKSADGTTHSQTNSDLPHDTNFHSWKLTLQSSDILLDIDGILKVTKTTNRPTRSMQPFVSARSNSNGAGRNMHVTYFEAYNL